MSNITVNPVKSVNGLMVMPGDKSISHRAVMISSIAEGQTEISNFLLGEDCLRTIEAFSAMGIEIARGPRPAARGPIVIVNGRGLRGLQPPKKELYLGNSGTTMRLLAGILAGQDFECVLTGDGSLSKRPMRRIAEPLGLMGAVIKSKIKNQKSKLDEIYPPLKIKGKYPLKAIKYTLPMASAQVKSAVLLAGLYAKGAAELTEPAASRDHTERMLRRFGARITVNGLTARITSSELKTGGAIHIPGDISSAAFFITAALILKSSKITIRDVGINPTRTGVIDILRRMGGRIEITGSRGVDFEPFADLTVYSSDLKGVDIGPRDIPAAIDELPIIAVAAVFASGTTVIKGASELRCKETDRIHSMVVNLKKMGAAISVDGDDITINGVDYLTGCEVDSFGDHRTAMSCMVAALRARGKTAVLNTECINKSFPSFDGMLNKLIVS